MRKGRGIVSALCSVRYVLASALLLASCDMGPSGPGTVAGTVIGTDLGGVVLDVTWRGVLGFEGGADTQVYTAPVTSGVDRYRVLLVSPTGGELYFGISVDDAYLEGPVVTVVSATDTANRAMPIDEVELRLER